MAAPWAPFFVQKERRMQLLVVVGFRCGHRRSTEYRLVLFIVCLTLVLLILFSLILFLNFVTDESSPGRALPEVM